MDYFGMIGIKTNLKWSQCIFDVAKIQYSSFNDSSITNSFLTPS